MMQIKSKLLALFSLTVTVCAQAPLWGQCGGRGYTGPMTCVAGAVCTVTNEWYSQCVPGSSSATTTAAPTTAPPTTPPPTTAPPSTTVPLPPSTTPGAPGATCAPMGTVSLASNAMLPDPFKFEGTTNRASTKAEWECRRKEIIEIFQRYELGPIPPKPSTLTGSFSGNRLTITASEAGKSISWTVTINRPSSCSASSPCPAMIAFGAASIPISAGVATILFANDDVAVDAGPRGNGRFYTLYGSSHKAGAMSAWSWGISRIIDALEVTPSTFIDPTRVGVTGCSRYGKASFIAAAMDTRVALSIPQEAGTGGTGCYRIAQSIRDSGGEIEAASNMVNTVWMSTDFASFTSSASVKTLPEDHHYLASLIAPRGLLVIDQTGINWLGPKSVYGCQKTGTKVYSALGVRDNMGISMAPGHNHCQLPSSQNAEVAAFMNKFLLRQNVATNVDKDNGVGFTESQWVNWSVPTLT